MLQVMLQTFEAERGASMGCRARIFTLLFYDFSFYSTNFGTCIIYMNFYGFVLWICKRYYKF